MTNYGDIVQEYYVKKFRENSYARQKKIASLKNQDDAWAFIHEIREKVKRTWNFPEEKCALNPQIIGTVETEKYSIRKVIFYSRPKFPVSANVYVPNGLTAKAPAVLVLCGHSLEGKACDVYQSVAASLCLQGCVAVIPDPIGQGERRQYSELSNVGNCSEHCLFCRRMLLAGDSFGAWRIYDAVRTVDYLLTLPEVDPERIGVTGNSGGGTMTSLINAVETRFKAAAPSCYITRWLSNVENELPADGEQIPPGFAKNGGDMADLLLAAAPRPIMILGQKNDFFDIRGTRQVYEEMKHIYTLLGYPENVRLFCGPTSHGYSIENREAAQKFFAEHLNFCGTGAEPEHAVQTEQALLCANNKTVELPGTLSVNDIFGAQVKRLVSMRKKYPAGELKKIVSGLLGIGKIEIPHYRQLRCRPSKITRTNFSRYALETEENMLAVMVYANRTQEDIYHIPSGEKAVLYVPNRDSFSELETNPYPADWNVFGIDYRGIGETMPNGCDQIYHDFDSFYQFDYHYASISLLLGESYLGGRVRDVISACKLLHACGNKEILLTADGIGRIPALLAAFLCDEPVKIRLRKRLETYEQDALSDCDWIPQSMGIFNILKYTDLDEIQDIVECGQKS